MIKVIPILVLSVLSSSIMSVYATPVENSLDCSETEINSYMDQSGFKKKKAFNTLPNTEEFIKAEIAKKKVENGEDADDCVTIFDEGVDTTKSGELLGTISEIMNDPMGGLSKAGTMATDRMKDLYEQTHAQLKKGLCERLTTESVTGSIGDQVDQVYKAGTKDTVLQGAKVNTSDIFTNGGGIGGGGATADPSEAIGKNFTYQILKNQLGKNASSIARMLDITNPNQADVVGDVTGDILDDNLDTLEDSIFGN
jgi:hypothetical protein